MKFRASMFAGAVALLAIVGLVTQQGDARASTVTSSVRLTVKAEIADTIGFSSASIPIVLERSLALANGVGATQADTVWSDQRTLTASSTEDLDLAGGGLTDAFGAAFAPAKIRVLVISASGSNTNDLVVFGDAASVPVLDTAATTHTIAPGGMAIFTAPALAGIAVTATTADIIQVANGGSGTSVTYDILIVGTSS